MHPVPAFPSRIRLPLPRFRHLLAFARIPGNALSFWIRETLRWSRGRPTLWQEDKRDLFRYLGAGGPAALEREAALSRRYRLAPLKALSTASLYRKNLYLLECLEKAVDGLPPCAPPGAPLRAADVGSQDWHYVFGLERWLRYGDGPEGRDVELSGIELDGHGIYPDFHSRADYARAYAEQTGNPGVRYRVEDFLRCDLEGLDLVTVFYPFVTRPALLLWGLPLRFFRPARLLERAAAAIRPGGRLLVFCHTAEEHERFLELGRASWRFDLLREGPALSDLVEFHALVEDRRYSLWRRRPAAHQS